MKLLCLLCVSVASFLFGFPALLASSVLIVAAAGAAGIKPWELLRGAGPLTLIIALVLLSRSVDYAPVESLGGFQEALRFGWALLLSFAAAALLFSVTTMTEIRDSLPQGPFSPLSLGIALMLGFMPRFFEIWENTELAYRARSGKKGPAQIVTLIPLTIERMIECAVETAVALEGRGLLL
jgi:biotin transport system permease protein